MNGTVELRPFDGDVFHSLLQMLVNASLVDLVGWPAPEAYQRAVDSGATLYRPRNISAKELPHAKAVARAINRIFRILYARGWRRLGSGSSCLVFGYPAHDYVLKLCHTPCRRDTWLTYALWAQANSMRSPALPRIDRIVKFESGSFFTFLAKVERLIPVSGCALALERARNMSRFFYASEKHAADSLPVSTTSLIEEIRRNFIDGGEYVADLDIMGPRVNNLMLRPSDREVVIMDPITHARVNVADELERLGLAMPRQLASADGAGR